MENFGFIFIGASEFPKSVTFNDGGHSFFLSYERLRNFVLLQTENSKKCAILDLFDSELSAPDQIDEIEIFLKSKTEHIRNLVVFYIGHGSLTAEGENYYLVIRSTRENQPYFTSIASEMLAKTLRIHGRGLRKFIFLDACFAASFAINFQAPLADVVRGQINRAKWDEGSLPASGTALLCASSRSKPAKFLEHGTMFSDALANILEQGRQGYGKYFTLEDLYCLVDQYIKSAHGAEGVNPELHIPDQRYGMIHGAPLFLNRYAYLQAETSSADNVRNDSALEHNYEEKTLARSEGLILANSEILERPELEKNNLPRHLIKLGMFGFHLPVGFKYSFVVLAGCVFLLILFLRSTVLDPSGAGRASNFDRVEGGVSGEKPVGRNEELPKTVVFFDFDKSILKPEGKLALDGLIDEIKNVELEVVLAVGHTDNSNGDAYAQKLSVRQAEAVKAYLVAKGVEKNRVYVEGMGLRQPLESNLTSEGRARNRRVEVSVEGCRKPCSRRS